jgi:phosphatidylglycerophosphatase A
MNPPVAMTSNAPRKPRLALAIATSLGLGYVPVAPGTFGSLAGIVVYALVRYLLLLEVRSGKFFPVLGGFWTALLVAVMVAGAGVWAATRTEQFSARRDPQFVVIDEVSGQQLTYLFALAPLNWKYLLLGFILFRVFDIWKPFPARQAESLPGGFGIMADDWIAGIYAALGLWLARSLGL